MGIHTPRRRPAVVTVALVLTGMLVGSGAFVAGGVAQTEAPGSDSEVTFEAYVAGDEGYLDTNAEDGGVEPIEFAESDDYEPTQSAIDAEPDYLPAPGTITMEGTIDEEAGTWEGDINFPASISQRESALGATYVKTQITTVDGAEGTIDRSTGEMTLEAEVDISIDLYNVDEFGVPWDERGDSVQDAGCHVPNVDLSSTTGQSGDLTGESLEGTTATLVGNEFGIDGAQDCGPIFTNAINDAQGIPTDSGQSEVVFDFVFEFSDGADSGDDPDDGDGGDDGDEKDDADDPAVGADPAQDLNGDDVYEDVDGDGDLDRSDVNVLFQNRDSQPVQANEAQFDFNGDERFDVVDVHALLRASRT